MKKIIIGVLAAVSAYVAASFIAMDVNAANWDMAGRVVFVCILPILIAFVTDTSKTK